MERLRRSFLIIYSVDSEDLIAVKICGFDGARWGNFRESFMWTEVKIREKKVKKGKVASRDEVIKAMIKNVDEKIDKGAL